MFKSGPNYNKLKTSLRLTINRLKLLEKKKSELALKARKEIADYISTGKDDRARIRVEHIIREDYLVEAMELLEMYCDLLLARFGLIQTQKELDPGLEESIASLIWATPRLQADVQELKAIHDEFAAKYGKEFALACRSNQLNNVSEKVMHKLSVQAPPKALVERYMVEIAKTYNIPFEPDNSVMAEDEIFAAENLLIDVADRNGKGGGPSGGMGVMQPMSASAPYPAQSYLPAPSASKTQPPLPSATPVGPSYPYPPAGAYVNPHGPPGSAPPYNPAFDAGKHPPAPIGFRTSNIQSSKGEDIFPDLPAVPSNSLPDFGNSVGTGSAGGEDPDFDNLNKRFEELKKRK